LGRFDNTVVLQRRDISHRLRGRSIHQFIECHALPHCAHAKPKYLASPLPLADSVVGDFVELGPEAQGR
jgi:hypothetical protein